jgi:hypothetical protein
MVNQRNESIPPTRALLRRSSMALAALALTDCGGGGGGASTPVPSPPPPPPADTVPFALTTANYGPATELVATVSEAVLQIGQLATDAVDAVLAQPPSLTGIPCANGGTFDLAFTDKNGDGIPNSGDSIQATYHNCFQSSIDDVVNGELSLSLGAAAASVSMDGQPSYSLSLQFGTAFAVGSPPATGVSGSLAVSLVRDSLTTTLGTSSSTADNLNLSVAVNGKTYVEGPRRLAFTKKLDYSSATYDLDLAMTYQSQALSGSLTLTTPASMSGFFNTYPIIGGFEIAGAAPNATSLVVGGTYVIPGNDQSTITLSADNFQTTAASQINEWASFTLGFMWWDPLSYPGVYPNGYAPQSLSTVTPFPAELFMRPVASATWPANLPIFVQYNVPVPNPSGPLVATLTPVSPAGASVPVTTSIQGARIVVTPQQALQSGTTYSFSLDPPIGGAIMSQFTAQ